jgi:hypothetical protein
VSLSVVSSPRLDVVQTLSAQRKPPAAAGQDPKMRKAFDSFVGETLFGQMLSSMRKTVGKPAYFHGGRAEEVFTQQLDQVLAQKLSQSSADKLSGPMYELMMAGRK